jgi:hypothetical protein
MQFPKIRGGSAMPNKAWVAVLGAVIAVAGLMSGPAAQADDTPEIADLSAEQQQAIAAWEGGAEGVTRDSPRPKATISQKGLVATSSGTRTLRLYRGSWAMWGQESAQFGFSDNRITWSDAWQDSGWVFPCNVTEGGTYRYYTSSSTHQWRGKYTVGSGVPTPWGAVNVYSDTSWARSQLRSVGAVQWWDS